MHRIHRREGVLQDQLDLRGVGEVSLGLDRDRRTLQDEVTGRRRHDSRQHSREYRLARAALAHDRHDFAGDQVETHVVDRAHDPLGVEQTARGAHREVAGEMAGGQAAPGSLGASLIAPPPSRVRSSGPSTCDSTRPAPRRRRRRRAANRRPIGPFRLISTSGGDSFVQRSMA